MDYEKEYNKIYEAAKYWHNASEGDIPAVLEEIFPELKESEDERMAKFIKKQLFDVKKTITENYELDAKLTMAIDWLEKQGEQKSNPCKNCDNVRLNCQNFPCIRKRAFEQGKYVFDVIDEEKVDNQNCVKPNDKVEPKFKVGDWITNNIDTDKIIGIDIKNESYLFENSGISDISLVDSISHLWTLEDAKDGDVLCYETKNALGIFIYKNGHIHYHCCYYNGHLTTVDSFFVIQKHLRCYIHPATKEQREQLEKAMVDAGYTFDFEKKELKLLITNGGDFDTKNCEQNTAWSEEDETKIKSIIVFLKSPYLCAMDGNKGIIEANIKYLESLKYRVQPQNLTISDEELTQAKKDAYNDALNKIEYHSGEPTFDDGWSAAIWYLKKRNVQPQYTWKPSDEQMKVLNWCKPLWNKPKTKAVLESLIEDLKKLRKE